LLQIHYHLKQLFSYPSFWLSILILSLLSCVPQQREETKRAIIIGETADAASLNPLSLRGELSQILSLQLFQPLLSIDFATEEVVGILAKTTPEISIDSLGNQLLTYNLREEARFDNGETITAKDVLFSLKMNICPQVENDHGADYFNFIQKVQLYPDEPLKITFHCQGVSNLYELASGGLVIIPSYHYDPDGLIKSFSYERLLSDTTLKQNDTIRLLAKRVNAANFAFDPAYIKGSGAYRLTEWQKGQRLVLEKKQAWWGDAIENGNTFFIANAPALQYEIIPDQTTALSALQSSSIDFLRKLSSKEFQKLQSAGRSDIITRSVAKHGYHYLGFNTNEILLQDPRVRKAIAYVLPKEAVRDQIYLGQAALTHVPLSPHLNSLINDTLKAYPYSPEKASMLLLEAGWRDSNEDGILDRSINGERQDLHLEYHYNSGNEQREAIGLLLKQELANIGIELDISSIEWSVYLQKLRSNELDLFLGEVVSLPVVPDYSSAFHSSSANGGRNYANYQNPQVDSLIEAIRHELDPQRQQILIHRFQELIHHELPYLPLLSPNEQLAYSNRLKEVNVYAVRPHVWLPELMLK
jgi:peptide/nickel transport system substrate-binding protein